MINLAVINLKTLLKKITKIIIVILAFAMIIKFTKILYSMTKKFDIEDLKLNSNIGMIKNNLAISKGFEKNETSKDSEIGRAHV